MTNSKYKTYNLEMGMPTWEQAERRLINEINNARKMGVKVLKVIHGYGSTGAGGKLKSETRKLLADRKRRNLIRSFVPGEEWSRNSAAARDLLSTYPVLKNDMDLNRGNEGITIVVL